MSTTIPLTLIEGSMALPSLSPLGRLLPPPFGRDWALLPPGHSLRAELKALYAAVLRTFCLDADTIRALCQWESWRLPPAVSSGFTSPASSTTVFDTPADESLRTSAEAVPFSPVPASPRGGSLHWRALAGGACALGGAAMLAWIGFGHLAQRHTISDAKPAGKVPIRQEAQSANRHSPDAAVTPYAVADTRPAVIAPSATTEIVTPVTATPARAIAGQNLSRRRDKLRESAPNQYKRSGRSSQTTIAMQSLAQVSRISPTNYEVPQIPLSANPQRASPKPSSAGAYSPLAPSQLGTDEYGSMTLSARTHLRDIAPPSRPASTINPPETGGTEWINHVSQRRVTEVPDEFAK
ncbi:MULTISPECIES: hypothetical protein [Paraburkholderia]|uniref:hypothetical protein n=1 Tax=Paraburkholderia TaxID=1822464 RepID=UPI0015C52527|nr:MULTISPECIES: hypothetical protein [Paraburkholderia]MCX4170794.1 hypothetical protein [Paraburkholderia madseniana]MDQ6458806.1 hypothetical protein [Paraburkholderia madseniana]NPT68007.1 hypothetical protein [Paraburkholderia madseniana]